MEGSFNFDKAGVAEVLSAPAWTRHAILQVRADLRQLANALENERLSDEDVDRVASAVADRIGNRDERLAQMVVEIISGKPRRAAAAFVLTIITVLGMIDAAVGGARLSVEVVTRIVDEVFDALD